MSAYRSQAIVDKEKPLEEIPARNMRKIIKGNAKLLKKSKKLKAKEIAKADKIYRKRAKKDISNLGINPIWVRYFQTKLSKASSRKIIIPVRYRDIFKNSGIKYTDHHKYELIKCIKSHGKFLGYKINLVGENWSCLNFKVAIPFIPPIYIFIMIMLTLVTSVLYLLTSVLY